MSALIGRWKLGVFVSPSLAALAVLSGCGVLGWREVYSSRRPGGRTQITVEEKCGLADCSMRMILVENRHSVQLDYRRGCNINFVHAAWLGPVVGVFVDGGTCQQIKIAYDTVARTTVPFTNVEEALRAAITAEYAPDGAELRSAGGDIFQWATYPGDGSRRRSIEEFRKRHPH
jgi:hypothetical protein